MKGRMLRAGLLLFAISLVSGCASGPKVNYEAFRAHMPRSILILPPLNNTSKYEATYGYLSIASQPFAEKGYYVFPVAVVDEFMKQNGMPTSGEMHQVPPQKVHEILGADAILYITILSWGANYKVVDSTVNVKARARLVDAATGTVLYTAEEEAQLGGDSGGGNSGLAAMLIGAAVKRVAQSGTESARQAAAVNAQKFASGFLPGPRHPQFKGSTP